MQTKVYLAVVFLSTLVLGSIFAKPARTSRCPLDKPQVNCFVDPCVVSSCPGEPEATCFANYCGGCNAVWLTPSGALADCSAKSKCPSSQEEVQCFKDPCQGETCPAYSDAICVANYCGGCNFEWFGPNGEQVQCDISS